LPNRRYCASRQLNEIRVAGTAQGHVTSEDFVTIARRSNG
jgi:hypothetical protein